MGNEKDTREGGPQGPQAGDWRRQFVEQLGEAAGRELAVAFDGFFAHVRQIVVASFEATGSALITQITMIPAVSMAYQALLKNLGISEKDLPPHPFVRDLIARVIADYRNRRAT